MDQSDFDYELPSDSIAQEPTARRDEARLLAHELTTGVSRHRRVLDLPELLSPGDLLVLNDTRVVPARLLGRRPKGGALELLLVEVVDGDVWRALVRPAKKLRAGDVCTLEGGALTARALERERDERGAAGACWTVLLEACGPGGGIAERIEACGRMPLPPYVRRALDDPQGEADRERYQTVYARAKGAVAAPTAGLHFTPELFERLEARGVERAFVTLHVGPGTFRPVEVERVEDHRMHAERFCLPQACVDAVARCRARGGRVVAVGTTVVRTLEACVTDDGSLESREGATDLFIVPGYRFRVVDDLMTNFHLPKSTLLMLVCAFAHREGEHPGERLCEHPRVLDLYRTAIDEGYRFYSYGDSMLLQGGGRGREHPS
ncbi:MAG TPA: tRNA preQ1(34) S-adenosylmethionine ribosyltransferase-isomerase QueA [Planctomycetota bacterium]|nr:tRNA preQ1(34) S-adenosylmethionine ribosyltransferase-isomerase QueA [Planctomycetota bacterium]